MGEPARSRDVKPGRTEGSPLDKTEKPEVLNLVKEEVSSGVKEVDEYPPQGEVLNLVKEKVFSGAEEGVYRPPHGEESDVKTVFQVYPEPEFDSDTCSEYADSEHIKRELDSLEDEEASVANEDGDEEEEKPSILALEAAMKAYESRSMGNETSPTFTVKSEFMPSTTNLEENPDASRSHLIMSGETESAKRMRNLKSPLEQEKRMLSSSSSSQGCGQEVPLSTQSFVDTRHRLPGLRESSPAESRLPEDRKNNKNKLKCKLYRESMKEDRVLHETFKKSEAERKRLARAQRSEDQKERERFLSRERSKAYRARQKATLKEKPCMTARKKDQTKSDEEGKERNRLAQQKRRMKMSQQKRAAERARNAQQMHKTRQDKKNTHTHKKPKICSG